MRNKKYTSPYREKLKFTSEMYTTLAEQQQFRCAVCSRFEWDSPKKRLCVDHEHTTGKIRGLLCHQCNVSLGLLQENPRIVQSLLNYIQRWQ